MTYIITIMKENLNLINYLFITIIIIIYLNKKTANFLRKQKHLFYLKFEKKYLFTY